jgi:hypothetical protein
VVHPGLGEHVGILHRNVVIDLILVHPGVPLGDVECLRVKTFQC